MTWPGLALGGGAGYRPRVRKVYYDVHLSPYPAFAGTLQYRHRRLTKKDRRPAHYGGCIRLLLLEVSRWACVALCAGDNFQCLTVNSLKKFVSPFNRIRLDLNRQRKAMQISLVIVNDAEGLWHSSMIAPDQLWNAPAEGVGTTSH